MYFSQNSIDMEPFVNQDLSDGKCLLIVGGKGLTEFGECISKY